MFTLQRLYQDQYGTHGEFLNELGDRLCYTEELQWKDNQHDISCITPGIYTCIKHNSADHPNTWEITNVKNRKNVLIHNGNYMKDTLACVLVGLRKIEQGVLDSVKAMDYLRTILPDTFELAVVGFE